VSHHQESPRARQHPQLDILDLYVFQAPGAGITLIQTLNASGPPGWDIRGQYAFHLDTDGDARPDLTLRVTFGPRGPGGQPPQVQLLHGSAGTDPDAGGQTVATGPAETIIPGRLGIRAWAGRAADPFYINPHVVGAVASAVQDGTPLDLRALAHAQPENLFAGCDVNAIVLEIPGSLLQDGGGPLARLRRGRGTRAGNGGRIGCWATTTLREDSGWLTIERCGLPLVPTIFLAQDGDLADAYNASHPAQDREKYGPLISRLAAQAAAQLGGCADPQAHGADVASTICPDILWYQPGTPAHFGFARLNGRAIPDPAAEVMLSRVTGRAIPLGIGAESAAGAPRSTFPYLSPPAAGPQPPT
jgi:Domain of unknown function (DUF4331)